jgi:hypothetical protein
MAEPTYRRADALERGARVKIRGRVVDVLVAEGPPARGPDTDRVFYVRPVPYTPGGNTAETLDYRDRVEVIE